MGKGFFDLETDSMDNDERVLFLALLVILVVIIIIMVTTLYLLVRLPNTCRAALVVEGQTLILTLSDYRFENGTEEVLVTRTADSGQDFEGWVLVKDLDLLEECELQNLGE